MIAKPTGTLVSDFFEGPGLAEEVVCTGNQGEGSPRKLCSRLSIDLDELSVPIPDQEESGALNGAQLGSC
jgi:hypothetical protein